MNYTTIRPVEILLVEDNPGDVDLIREVLLDTKVRNTLHVVDDGEQALNFLRGEAPYEGRPRPDVVLLDLNLPRMDGRALLEIIKEDTDLRRIPIVVLTTSRAEQDIIKSYNLHANCYIIKPLDLDQFIEVVRAIENFWLTIVCLPDA